MRPWMLTIIIVGAVWAGTILGKKATVSPSFQGQLAAQGALVVTRDVVQDGKLLTASGPQVAREFASALVKMLE